MSTAAETARRATRLRQLAMAHLRELRDCRHKSDEWQAHFDLFSELNSESARLFTKAKALFREECRARNRALADALEQAQRLSEGSFARVWDNPADAQYDREAS